MKTLQIIVCGVCVSLSVFFARGATDEQKVAESAALAKTADEKLQQATMPPQFEEVAGLLEKAVKLNRANYMAQRTLGWVYLDKLHDAEAAYPHLAIAAKGMPEDADSRKLFALAAVQTGRPHRAVEEFQKALDLAPNDLWVRANLGRTLAKCKRYDEARVIFDDVLRNDPKNVDARLGLAEIEAWQGRTSVALVTLDQLVLENPRNVEVLVLRGDVHRWNWDLTQAEEDYNQALAVEKNYNAEVGLEEAHRMGASDIHGKVYYFRDTTHFVRESGEAGTRIHVADKLYLIGSGAAWRFTNPGTDVVKRYDGAAGLEMHFARWLSATAEGTIFDYEHGISRVGGRFLAKLSPVPQTDFYAAGAYQQPFVSSIATVQGGLREDSVGGGFDVRLGNRFSVQTAARLARISDHNEWWEARPQLSYRLFGEPDRGTFLRVEYDYLSYSHFRTNYWTPDNRHVVAPVLDVCIPLGRHVRIDVVGKAPYVFDASRFGWQVEGGPTFQITRWVELKGSYIYGWIPKDRDAAPGVDRPPWSGQGGQVSLAIRF